MATLQEALEGVQNGKMYMHHHGGGVREFLSLRTDSGWAGYVQHDVIGPEGGGQASFTPDYLRRFLCMTPDSWEPTDTIG